MARRLNLDGDGQGDTAGHGGEQRAVFVYQLQSYEHWERYFGQDQRYFGTDDREYGQFGENFTVDGLLDDEVCIGDRYRIGEAEFEVTQPRVTCYRVGMRLGQPQLPALLVSHHRPGFYLRVITEGRVQAGDEIVRTRIGPGALSVSDTDALLYLPGHDPALLRRALDIPALSPGWQGSFRDLLADATPSAGSGAKPPAGSAVEPVVDPAPAWPGFRPLRVTRIVRESSTVSSILLDDPAGSPLPAALAGQYLTFRITGAGHPAPVRSYSLSSAPGDAAYRDQRQARTARRGQQLPGHRPAGGGHLGRRRPPRRLRPGRRGRAGAAGLRRDRGYPRAGHAARSGGPAQPARGLVDPCRPRAG